MTNARQSKRPSVAPLPTRDGVGPSCTVLPVGPWSTIAEYLVEQFPAITADEWQRRMGQGEVVDAAGLAVDPQRVHEPNLRVYYYRTALIEPRIPFDETILFQDEHLVVADKPHFLPVTPSGRFLQETLLVRLKRKLGIDSLIPLHRIDSGTAGVVIFAVQESTRGAYQAMFRDRVVDKSYEAIAPTHESHVWPLHYESRLEPDTHFMRTREVSGEANAFTTIELIGVSTRRSDMAHYRLMPTTGRKHQLRVQCAALGMAILNDPIYPVLAPEHDLAAEEDFSQPLQLLARSITFRDPITREWRHFVSERQLAWI